MTPLKPPPPICAARCPQVAGRATRKLIGRAVVAVSTGAMNPSTRQCAGALLAASTHVADDSVTALTGSPMADGSIDVPTLAAAQSAAEITTSGPSRRSVSAAGAGACAPVAD